MIRTAFDYKYVNPLLLLVLAVVFLPTCNYDFLYAIQEHSLFVGGRTFMSEIVRGCGEGIGNGKLPQLLAWAGCYLTQFFYYPWLGTAVIAVVWMCTYYALTVAFRLKDLRSAFALIPLAALIVSITDVGYWLYYMKVDGYWFAESLTYFFAVIFMLIVMALLRKHNTPVVGSVVALLTFVLMAILGFRVPEFEAYGYRSVSMSMPFVVCIVTTIFLPLVNYIRINLTKAFIKPGLYVVYIFCLALAIHVASYRNDNFQRELRMYRAIDEGRWADVVNEHVSAKGAPTNLMVLYKNLALLKMGTLQEQMFKTDNCGVMPDTGDSLEVHITQIAAPLLYYHFGKVNYAYRWAMENSVNRHLTVDELKVMIRCCLANHEFDVAAKYIALLRQTKFHKHVADKYKPMLFEARYLQEDTDHQGLMKIVDLRSNVLDNDDGLIELFLIEDFSSMYVDVPVLEDMAMCASLWKKDKTQFLHQFVNYCIKHNGQTVPLMYQEAALLHSSEVDSPVNLSSFKFDKLLYERYNSFANDYAALEAQKLTEEEMGERMKPIYGDTYWWYYYFYNDFNIY